MSSPTPDPTRDLPPLPAAIHDELLDILFGDPRSRETNLQRLMAQPGLAVDAVRAHIAFHDSRTGKKGTAPQPSIPGYRILRQLGEGGMGVVFEAEQIVPLQRRVAVKVIKSGASGREVTERFARERQSLAVMDHDAIAKVYDCGTTPTGQPFFAMEYVEGKPIDAFADEHRLPLRARIELFLEVCRGVQHAHQKGVIHRDLKPGNVLVGERDGKPFAKVIDFGIARAVVRDRNDEQLQTEAGRLVGTPDYMSPEQAEGDNDRIDTRTDVYSLGAMLYELLCGASPFASRTKQALSLAELRDQLRAGDLPRPSTRLRGLGELAAVAATRRRATTTGLARALAGDLDWIVLRAIAKEPDRRYPSAIALADDLQRHLDGMPVTAGPPTAWYRLRKLARRYRAAFLTAGLVLLAVVAGLIGTGLALARVQQSRARFDLLSLVVALRDAKKEAAALHPAWSHQATAFAAWHADRSEPLLRAIPGVQAALAELAGTPRDDDANGDPFLREELTTWLQEMEAFGAHEVVDMRARGQWAAGLATLQAQPWIRQRWQEARTAIGKADGVTASQLYASVPIDLQPQEGLVPLGMNPRTRLWEFYDLRSATDLAVAPDPGAVPMPTFADDGLITVGEATGIVFVLVPGGTFTVGAQNDDPSGPNYDEGMPDGGKTHVVTLAPFFLARHEMTQGQWLRLGGAMQPCYPKGTQFPGTTITVTLAHPIEQISWTECSALLTRHGMQLPTDVQWEYACRAGTTTPWAFGETADDLRDRVNLLDSATQLRVPQWQGQAVPWDDGYMAHAPVGILPANAFGLHEVHGNVNEWCADGHASAPKFAPGDGKQVADDDGKRLFRGGSFLSPAQAVRSAWRFPITKDWRSHELGCRAVRALQPRGA